MSGTRSRRVLVVLVSVLVLFAGDARGGPADEASRPSQAQEQDVPRVFQTVTDPNGNPIAWVMTLLRSHSAFEYSIEYRIYFPGSANSGTAIQTGFDDAGNPEMERFNVASVTASDASKAEVLACVHEDDRVDTGDPRLCQAASTTISNTRFYLKIALDEELESGKFLRLDTSAGLATIDEAGDGQTSASPELQTVLPRLGEADERFFGAFPEFQFEVTPVVDDQQGDSEVATAFNFEGSLNRFSRNKRVGFSYSGNISSNEEISFNRLKADFEYERNLAPRSYLPLVATAGLESDQQFDVVNVVAGAHIQRIIGAINLNYSPRNDDYIPNVGPLVEGIIEVGTKLTNPEAEGDGADDDNGTMMAMAAPDDFARAGYEVNWTIPLAKNTVGRLHHAGIWIIWDGTERQVEQDDQQGEFHALWDIVIETKIGALTYYVGYQKGEAPPLFMPIETTRAGISFWLK